MKIKQITHYLTVILLLAMTACAQASPAPTATLPATPTQTAAPTETAVPTHTEVPDDILSKEPTNTPTATSTPKPTATPAPTEDTEYRPGTRGALFPIPDQMPGRYYFMPTPIPMPQNNQYLIALSSEDALNLVQIADKYSYDADIGLPLGKHSIPPICSYWISAYRKRFTVTQIQILVMKFAGKKW